MSVTEPDNEEILASTSTVEHVCSNYYVSKYDKTNHWNECSICGKKDNVVAHTYTETWTMGESCSPSNKCNHVCSCGYSYQTNNTREHNWTEYLADDRFYRHRQYCRGCGTEKQGTRANCTKEDGSTINCNSIGTCVVCGYQYTRSQHAANVTKNGDAKCTICNIYVGTVSNISTNYLPTNKVELSFDLSINSSGNFDNVTLGHHVTTGIVVESNTKTFNNSTSIHVVQRVSYPNNELKFEINNFVGNYYVSAGELVGVCNVGVYNLSPDQEPPVINPNIVQTNLATSNGWATQKQITITGTENFCSSVKLTLKDSEGNTYLNNAATPVTNNAWTYTFVPDIEANEAGKQFTIIVTDNLGNSSEKSFAVEKTDKKAPTITSAGETGQTWTKTKPFTFTATDEGSGGVSIAINNTTDYVLASKTGTTYSRAHTFEEEVYGSKNITVYFKDALGNAKSQTFKVYNIDSTAPTITGYEIVNNEIVLTGNDRNATLNKEGSGIVKYKYLGSSSEDEADVGAGLASARSMERNNIKQDTIIRTKKCKICIYNSNRWSRKHKPKTKNRTTNI